MLSRYYTWMFFITIASIGLTNCMVGPHFHSPNAPTTKTYTGSPLPSKTTRIPSAGKAGSAQYFLLTKSIPASWWTLFHSPVLNELVLMGLRNSPNLEASKAALCQAQELLKAQIGSSLLPSVDLVASAERQRFSGASVGLIRQPSLFSLYNTQVNVAYTLDLFGGARREIEYFQAQVDYQYFELEAAYLTQSSNIVTTAITIASLRNQIQATKQIIRSQEAQMQIISKQLHLGGVSKADLLSQIAQVAQTRATLPPLEQNLARNLHALSILIGLLPNEYSLPSLDLAQFHLPTVLPVTLPSLLVRQRPDIRASEALLHAASARIGVATANLFPQITLTGNYGWTSTSLTNFFDPINNVWSIGGQVAQHIFNGGALLARKRAAIAAYKQAAAQYRQTVLQAFQNVADSLRALENDANELKAFRLAELAAEESLRITQRQFRLGGVSYLSLLNAERQYQQTKISRIQAEASRYTDTAALFQALGGGWWQKA